MFKKGINILHLEDNLADAELIAIELHQHCEECKITHVKNEQEFITALNEENFDLVLSDYNVLGFQGLEIYRAFKKAELDIPFIFVSGTIGEEKAVDVLREGVTDYVTKQNLGKLHIAITRAIKESSAKEKLLEQEKFWSATLNSLSGHIAVVNKDGEIIATNDAWDSFAEKNKDVSSFNNVGVGANYFKVVEKAAATDKTIREIHEGILRVNRGETNYFYMDYPCHSPKEKRWYTLRVTPLKDSDNIIISHANITDRVLAEQEVLKSYEKLELIASNIGEIVYKLQLKEGNKSFVDYISNNVKDIIGFSADDYINGNPDLVKSMKPEQYKEAVAFNQKVRSSKVSKQFTFEYEWFHPVKKEWIWLKETLVPEVLNGKVVGQFGKVTDITAQKLAQKVIEATEAKYEGLFNKMKEGLLYSDLKGEIILVNPAFCDILNYKEEELLGKNGYELLLPEEEKEKLKNKIKNREKGNAENYEARMLTKDGNIIYVSISASPQFVDGELEGVMSIITDITKTKLAELEKENHNKTTAVINQLLELSYKDVPLEKILAKALDLIIELPFLKILPKGAIFLADDNDNLEMTASKNMPVNILNSCSKVKKGHCLCGKTALSKELVYEYSINENNEHHYNNIEDHGHYVLPILDKEKLKGVLNVYLNEGHERNESEIIILEAVAHTLSTIIGNKEADDRLKESEKRLVEAQQIAQIGNWELDLKTDTLYWSDQNYTVFGVTKEEFEPTYDYFLSLIHPEDRDKVNKAYMAHVKSQKPYSITHRILLPNGTIKYIHEKCESIFDENGQALISKGTSQDITESKKIENIFEALSNTSSTHGGASYFTEVANQVCNLLGVKYVFIGKRVEDEEAIQTLGFSKNGITKPNFRYELKDTPCKVTLEKEVNLIENNIQQLYPKDIDLPKMGVESYFGISLSNDGEEIGIIALLDDKPMQDIDFKNLVVANIKNRTETEIKRLNFENLLKEREERFRGLIENSTEITCIVDVNGLIKFITPSVTSSLGYIENELVSQDIFGYIHPEYIAKAEENLKKCIDNPDDISYDVYLVKSKKGEYKYFRAIVTNHTEKKGIEGFIINAQDVTDFINSEKNKFFNILKAEEGERTRIAHDLHDGLGQTIAAANMSMNALEAVAKSQLSEEAYSIFKAGKDLVNQATKETRMVSHNIMPRSLKEYGIEESVKGLINNYQNINKEIEYNFKSNLKDKRFSKEIELTCFRVLQEAINNSVKYSQSSTIDIEVKLLGKRLFLDIQDQGIGFDIKKVKESKKGGLGLSSMTDRIETIGGKLTIKSAPKKGTHVSVVVRLENNHFELEEFL